MAPQAFGYRNTFAAHVPGWAPGSLSVASQPRGIGYQRGSHFVHMYQVDSMWWVVSPGLTATEAASGTLADWINRTFGATDVVQQIRDAGQVTEWIWRPGLFYIPQVRQALDATEAEQRRADQSLHLLLERLTDLLLYIEPEGEGLNAYSLKTRELLILAATDVEDMWSRYLRQANVVEGTNGYTTNQYVRLAAPLHLADYQLSMSTHPAVAPVRPFLGWDPTRPTQSLTWYDAYNKTKHDKTRFLSAATLRVCFEAVAACVVMYCVRFSPYPLFTASTPVASLAQHLLTLEIVDPSLDSFYVPLLDLPTSFCSGIQVFASERMHAAWTAIPLSTVL